MGLGKFQQFNDANKDHISPPHLLLLCSPQFQYTANGRGAACPQTPFKNYKNFPQKHPGKCLILSHCLELPLLKHMEGTYQTVQLEPEPEEEGKNGISGFWKGSQHGLPCVSMSSVQSMRLESAWTALIYHPMGMYQVAEEGQGIYREYRERCLGRGSRASFPTSQWEDD